MQLTLELLEHTLHGARAAAAGHGDVELVVVFGHCECDVMLLEVRLGRRSGGVVRRVVFVVLGNREVVTGRK